MWRWMLIGALSVTVFCGAPLWGGGEPRPARASHPGLGPSRSWTLGIGDWVFPNPHYPSLFPSAPTVGAAPRRIIVDLSQQQLTAFEGDTPVRAFPVSTGDAAHPTIVGRFAIQHKYERTDLIGADYYYRDVPYVMAFARPFYIHAAPWRAEFGVAASRGCVTLAPAAAAWLFDWAEVGTPLVIRW